MRPIVQATVEDDYELLVAIEDKARTSRPRHRLVARARVLAITLGGGLALLGLAVAVGWLLDRPGLQGMDPGGSTMKLTTALSLLALGGGLVLAGRATAVSRVALILAAVVGAHAVLVLVTYAVGVTSPLDNPLGLDDDPGSRYPGRMTVVTAVALTLLSTSLAQLTAARYRTGQLFAIAAFALTTTTLVGHLYEVEALYEFGPFPTIALHTAAALWVGSVALVLLEAGRGYASLLVGNTAGGVIVRRLLPPTILLPVILGAVLVRGIDEGVLDPATAMVVFVGVVATVVGAQVWWLASRMRHVDLRRAGAEEAFALARSALRLRDDAERRLQVANDDLASFSAGMAHDLRTPLTTIRGFGEMLAMFGPDDPRAGEWIGRIDGAARRGSALVDSILAFAALGRADLRLADIDLDLMVREVADQEIAGSERAGRVAVEPLPHVLGDEALLEQLLGNLVGNALKYVPDDRDPVVVVDATPVAGPVEGRDLAGCVVRVTDNGSGVPEPERDRIFEMFRRGSGSGGSRGSGVGLAICRRIAEMHGGRIWVEEAPGGGSRFCVLLDATSTEAPPGGRTAL